MFPGLLTLQADTRVYCTKTTHYVNFMVFIQDPATTPIYYCYITCRRSQQTTSRLFGETQLCVCVRARVCVVVPSFLDASLRLSVTSYCCVKGFLDAPAAATEEEGRPHRSSFLFVWVNTKS